MIDKLKQYWWLVGIIGAILGWFGNVYTDFLKLDVKIETLENTSKMIKEYNDYLMEGLRKYHPDYFYNLDP